MNKLKYNLLVFLVFGLIGFLLYYPILDNNFLSDDYDSLYRVCIQQTIIVKEFFRPLIDISFKFNYLLGGFDSSGYYILNLVIHIANVFIVYKIANVFKPENDKHDLLSWLSAFLFLIYPFHNEAVVWLTGRLASIACFFALLCIYVWLGNSTRVVKAALSITFYFTGLLAYESIVLLPLVIFILTWNKTNNRKNTFLFLGISFLVTVGYLLLRSYVSGNVYGDYGARMMDVDFLSIIIKAAKTMGRFFLPPSENSNLLIFTFVAIVVALIVLSFRLYKMYSMAALTPFIKLIMALVVASSIPLLFGISTRTGESDRLLYFPSVFLCMIFAMLIQLLIKTISGKVVAVTMLSIYFITCLLQNNKNWEKASLISGKVLGYVKEANRKNVVFINLPDEIEGAFVFRNGFTKAMVLNNIDTGKIWVNNMLTRLEYLELKEVIHPLTGTGAFVLPPVTKISFIGNDSVQVENISNLEKRVFPKENTTILYWNTVDMIRLF
ncbi:hypothetical protein DC498_00515 [Terrimonas sp.]|uniref:hypothetical protein n=1 Tax=Terrimonas sp. TaxID=1914338 RepID=UPI000D517E10|nr:hypothetical protein [Terrimonas sp.]PVD53915.1 hypothetical protein DC498_00515 [Terrimonas sp.]